MQSMKVNTTITQESTALQEINLSGDANALHYLLDVKEKLALLKAQHQLLRSDMVCLANEMNTARQVTHHKTQFYEATQT